MRVAIDISPIKTEHRVRGIGAYTQNLINQFKKESRGVEFKFFSKPNSPPPADIIHYPYFDLFFHTLPIRKKARRVVTIHDVIPLIFRTHFPVGVRGSINLFLQKRALKNTDFVICDSKASKTDIANKLSYPAEKIHVVYLAAGKNFKKLDDQSQLLEIRKKFRLPNKFVLYVGDVNWNKNIEGLILALAKIKIHLVLVGQAITNGNLAPVKKINRLINQNNLEKRIIKTGFVNEDDLIAIYNLAELAVQPSFYEGFGLPVLESMACGTPVICSNSGSLSEIAGPAIICDPTDPNNIAASIERVLGLDSKTRAALIKKGFEHGMKFSWQKTAQKTINIYKKFLQ